MRILLTVSIFLMFNTNMFPQAFGNIEVNSNRNTSYKAGREYYANNNLYLEGSSVIQSINFETKLYRSESNLFQLNGRFGLGYFYIDFFGVQQSAGALAGLNILLGRKSNHFETSLGVFAGSDTGFFQWLIATLGYKYQKPEGGFIFRLNIGTLLIGVGFGYAF